MKLISIVVVLDVCLHLTLGLYAPNIKPQSASLIIDKDDVIVLLKNTNTASASLFMENYQQKIKFKHSYEMNNFTGFAANANASTLEALKNDPRVAGVYPDGVVNIACTNVQSPASWNLKRISGPSITNAAYKYNPAWGTNVCVYIIDTGIYIGHNDMGGRAKLGWSYTGQATFTDGNGHGTCCASLACGKDYGVARKCTLIAVQVLDASGSGSYSNVIAGVNWVVNDKLKCPSKYRKVINMSLGGSKYQPLNDAIKAAVTAGITTVVAAGNSNMDAASVSPASEPTAITVGASGSDDAKASFSNYGSVVDIFAPGVNDECAFIGSPTTIKPLSGTSMASPMVAGVAAVAISHWGATNPTTVRDKILLNAVNPPITSVPSGTTTKLVNTKCYA